MGFNNKKFFFGKEIIFNSLGQIKNKKRFLFISIINYFRYIIK